MGKVYAVGVGPGSPKYVTEIVKEIVQNCDILIGYKYTLKTIENLIEGKEIYEITMNDQENSYQKEALLRFHKSGRSGWFGVIPVVRLTTPNHVGGAFGLPQSKIEVFTMLPIHLVKLLVR